MRVKNLLGDDFDLGCKKLAELVLNDNYKTDIIIGVLTGGGYIGRIVYDYLKDQNNIYVEIRIQRPMTKKKKDGLLHKLISKMPEFMCDLLRMLESVYLEYNSKKHSPKREGTIVFNDDVETRLKNGNQKVLIIDDAIDTGATLALIKDHINNNYPGNTTKIGVVTVTMCNPCVMPDYCLYNNRTLVRFPWSNDVKKKNE